MSAVEFQGWIGEDVRDLLTDEECAKSKKPLSDSQRCAFVKEFWEKRNPSPGFRLNDVKLEHYRRRIYASTHFSPNALNGTQTDRGRVFVLLGPPDCLKVVWPPIRHGLEPDTFPAEIWIYESVTIRGRSFKRLQLLFIDTAMKGEYRLTSDDAETRALISNGAILRQHACSGPALALLALIIW